MSWLHFGAKKNHRVSPMGSPLKTQEGSNWKQLTRIFYLTAPGGKIMGSVDTDGIYLEYSKVYDTVS